MKYLGIWSLIGAMLFSLTSHAEWRVDLSRRQKNFKDMQGERGPASEETPKGFFDAVLANGDPIQEIAVFLNEKGFVPSTLRLRNGVKYVIHIVNVNEKEKNVSFVLDAFSEHHAMYFGKVKTFTVEPKKDGVFSFVSPELSAEGRVIVFSPGTTLRIPSSESPK